MPAFYPHIMGGNLHDMSLDDHVFQDNFRENGVGSWF
jgi:hypothetical protein